MRRFKVLLGKYVAQYAIFSVVMLCMLWPIRQQAYTITRMNVVNQWDGWLETSLSQQKAALNRMSSYASILSKDADLMRLAFVKPEETTFSTVYMQRVQRRLEAMIPLVDGALQFFILFENNRLCISNAFVSTDYRQAYGVLFSMEGLDADSFHQAVMAEPTSLRFMQSPWVLDVKAKNRTMVLVRGLLDVRLLNACAFLIVVDTDILLGPILKNLPDQGFARLLDVEGRVIASAGANPQAASGSHMTLQRRDDEYGVTLLLGIPTSVIEAGIRELMLTISLLITLALLLATLLGVGYALWQYRRMSGLLRLGLRNTDLRAIGRDEYRFLGDLIDEISTARNSALREKLLMNNLYKNTMLINACLHGVHTQAEQARICSLLGELSCYVVAVLCVEAGQTLGEDPLLVEDRVREALRWPVLCAHRSPDEVIFLIHAPQDKEAAREDIALRLGEAVGNVCSVGVSATRSGWGELRAGYHQALYAARLHRNAGDGVSLYQADANAAPSLSLDDTHSLFERVRAGEKAGAQAQIRRLGEEAMRAGDSELPLMLFFSLRMVLCAAAAEIPGLQAVPVPPAYEPGQPFDLGFARLGAYAGALCDLVVGQRRSKNERLKAEVADYIRAHITDPGLCAASVAQAFGLSEKYVFVLVREQTGKAFGEHVEGLRLALAASLLLSTDMTNDELAASAGFGSVSTLYRAFRRVYGMPPNAWKRRR